jgi:hypothetical protein
MKWIFQSTNFTDKRIGRTNSILRNMNSCFQMIFRLLRYLYMKIGDDSIRSVNLHQEEIVDLMYVPEVDGIEVMWMISIQ